MAKLGLHTFAAAPKWDLAKMYELVEKFHEHKVRALEIPLLDPAEINVEETRKFCETTGISPICSLGLPHDIDVINDPDSGLAFLKPAFEVAAGVGSFALAGVTYGSIGKISGKPRTQSEVDGTAKFIGLAAKMAKRYDLKLGIEPCNRYETHIMNTGAEARDFCDQVGADNVFIHLDSYHMNIEEISMLDGIKSCGPHLGYVHLSESNRAAPGNGSVNWEELFSALLEINFDGITTLESMNHVHPAIASALAIWRPVEANPDDVIELGLPFIHKIASKVGFEFA